MGGIAIGGIAIGAGAYIGVAMPGVGIGTGGRGWVGQPGDDPAAANGGDGDDGVATGGSTRGST